MNPFARAGVAALALVAASAPINSASAQLAPVATFNTGTALTAFYVVGLFLCAGMSFGRQDMLASKAGVAVTGAERFKALAGCLLPPVGLANLDTVAK